MARRCLDVVGVFLVANRRTTRLPRGWQKSCSAVPLESLVIMILVGLTPDMKPFCPLVSVGLILRCSCAQTYPTESVALAVHQCCVLACSVSRRRWACCRPCALAKPAMSSDGALGRTSRWENCSRAQQARSKGGHLMHPAVFRGGRLGVCVEHACGGVMIPGFSCKLRVHGKSRPRF